MKVHGGGFEVGDTEGERYQGRTAIICSGKRPKMLGVPGEEKLRGKGLTYCSVCDGPLFAGMEVAVIGGGNSAMEAAIDMSRIASRVYLVSLTPLTGDHVLREKVAEAANIIVAAEHQTIEVTGDGLVSGIRVKDLKSGGEKVVQVAGVFVEIGLMPNSDFARDLLTLNALGEIMINGSCETGVPGLYTAGDVTSVPAKQIVVAAGGGGKGGSPGPLFLKVPRLKAAGGRGRHIGSATMLSVRHRGLRSGSSLRQGRYRKPVLLYLHSWISAVSPDKVWPPIPAELIPDSLLNDRQRGNLGLHPRSIIGYTRVAHCDNKAYNSNR